MTPPEYQTCECGHAGKWHRMDACRILGCGCKQFVRATVKQQVTLPPGTPRATKPKRQR